MLEVLVAVAIMSLLAAILFPIFAQAREKARQTTCLSNQKQIGLAILMYAQDYDEMLPHGNIPILDGTQNQTWPETLWLAGYKAGSHTMNLGGTFECPSSPQQWYGLGCSYVGSDALFTPMQWADDARPTRPTVPLAQVTEPTRTVALTDGVYSGYRWFYAIFIADEPDWAAGRPNGWEDAKEGGPAPGPGIAFRRHHNGATYLFLDGHSKWMPDPRQKNDASHASLKKFHSDFIRVER